MDFPGGPVVKNHPCNTGDSGSIPDWGTMIPHIVKQQGWAPKSLSLCLWSPRATTRETAYHSYWNPVLWGPSIAATEPWLHNQRACAQQQKILPDPTKIPHAATKTRHHQIKSSKRMYFIAQHLLPQFAMQRPRSIPGSGSPGGGNGNPLQYSCLENSMERGLWWAIVHGVTERHDWVTRTKDHQNLTCRCLLKLFIIDLVFNFVKCTNKHHLVIMEIWRVLFRYSEAFWNVG